MNHNYSLKRDNVMIKPLEEHEIEHLRNWRNDATISEFLSVHKEITKEQQLAWFTNYTNEPNIYMFAIYETRELNRIVGSLALYNVDEIGKTADIGKIIIGDREARGKTIGRKSMLMAADIAFEKIGLNRLNLNVHEDNEAARKCYEAIGFKESGRHPFEKGGYETEMFLEKV